MDEEGVYDAVNGWAVDERNWAVMTAAVNWCETAQQWLGGAIDYMQVLMPNENASSAELAWHFYLPGLNSGFMYVCVFFFLLFYSFYFIFIFVLFICLILL